MMNLKQSIEQIAATIVGANLGDLPALADLHSQFEAFRAQVEQAGDWRNATPVCGMASNAARTVEQIILGESQDAAASMSEVAKAVAGIQAMIDQAIATKPPPSEEKPAATQSVISADDAPLVLDFIGESRGHIESAEAGVLKVEEHPDDLEAINAIFRAFHTIKGVAGFLNLSHIGS